MKRTACLLLALMLAVFYIGGCANAQREKYEQNMQPFSGADVAVILQGKNTVADYVNAVQPVRFSWSFLGLATRETQLIIQCSGGTLTICFVTEDGTIGGEADGEDVDLPEEIMGLPATVMAIEWLSVDFTGIPVVRGVSIGDSREKVLSSYLRKGPDAQTMYTITDVNAQANGDWIADWAFVGGRLVRQSDFYAYDALEYGWCELKSAKAWKLYYTIYYDLQNDKVHSVRLYIEGDEKDKP
jgi:hypothetical protein